MQCGRCDAIVAGDAIQCAQCGWFIPDDEVARRKPAHRESAQLVSMPPDTSKDAARVFARVLAKIGFVYGELDCAENASSLDTGGQLSSGEKGKCWRVEAYVRLIIGYSVRSGTNCQIPEPLKWRCPESSRASGTLFNNDVRTMAQRLADLDWEPTEPHEPGKVTSLTWKRTCLITEPISHAADSGIPARNGSRASSRRG
jgi:hypothetical protein